MQASSSNFSVEQVELIRRLRNSGITYQQLIDAFQALERIDATFGNTFNTPVCNSLHDARTVGAQGFIDNITHTYFADDKISCCN
ncbi:hypothetical protein RRG08_044354 [Elysia crispata]|uniref:HNF-p1 domain-containing protein n=1 Tax=Elysia crispata TaxID=231223 RepID=A0AAE1A997_9GAST|nr:hypothetical protein RRG08_044354 [Elysia crispata]